MVTKPLRPMKSEMLVLEEVAEREVEVPIGSVRLWKKKRTTIYAVVKAIEAHLF